jgi:hypothetical protein
MDENDLHPLRTTWGVRVDSTESVFEVSPSGWTTLNFDSFELALAHPVAR